MKLKVSLVLIVLAILSLSLQMLPSCYSDNISYSYQLLNKPDGSTPYRLNVVIPQSLLEYYVGNSHALYSDSDFAEFVTPNALRPIAEVMQQIYQSEEDFANGVLMIVHQINYEPTVPSKYPVETMAVNSGDCDLFSYIAASIVAAAGMNAVLFYYESEAHMNLGVSLAQPPEEARGQPYCMTYNGVEYYVAECTGGNWQTGWRVGECPPDLKFADARIITLENMEQVSVGQVSASLNNLSPSTISLSLSTTIVTGGSPVTLSGELSPLRAEEAVSIYMKVNSEPWRLIGTTLTDTNGRYMLTWTADSDGICYFRGSWSGSTEYAAADSPVQSVTVISTFFIILLVVTAVLVSAGVIVLVMSRQTHQPGLELLPPEIPT